MELVYLTLKGLVVIILYKIILMLHQSFSRFSRVLYRFSVYPANLDLSSTRGTFKVDHC